MKTLKLLLAVLLFAALCPAQVKKEALPALIESKKFVFKANMAIPFADADLYEALRALGNTGGGSVPLNSAMYDLQILGDSIVAFLPYFGRSYTTVVDREELSIKFSSKKFSYKRSEKKKGGWRIQIATQDVRDGFRFSLDIQPTGFATLQVRDAYRQPISYYGYIDHPYKE